MIEILRANSRLSDFLHGDMWAGIAGMYTHSEEQDNGALYSVTIEIADGRLIVDLRDNPDRDGGAGS